MTNAQARKKLGYGYALPIAGAAFGTIIGLMLNDVLPERYDFWTWVVVQLTFGFSLVIGTRYSASARNYELKTKKLINANGARIMNFVLSIIWSTAAGIMALIFAATSIENLKRYSWQSNEVGGEQKVTIEPITIEIVVRDFLPTALMLVIFILGTLLWLVNRAREE